MLMSVVEPELAASVYGELAGARVLLTGLSARGGVDVARSFAEHKGRLILHTEDFSPDLVELVAHLGESALELKVFEEPIANQDAAMRLAQKSAAAFGGLDLVINFIAAEGMPEGCDDYDAIEDYVSRTLLPATLITRVAANRMRLVHSDGLVLNVVSMPPARTRGETALGGIVRAALAELTRREAEEWASAGVRINAIGPRGADSSGHCLASEPEMAALALYLASRKGRSLSGQVFDAENAALYC